MNATSLRSVFVLAVIAASALSSDPLRAERKSAGEYFKDVFAEADSLYEKEKWEAASVAYRRIVFASPRNQKALKRLRAIDEKVADALVEKARAAWPTDVTAARAVLERAHLVHPSSKAVKALFKEKGYSLKKGVWVKKSSARDRSRESRLAAKRRTDLELSRDFKIIRRGVYRFFTDLEGAESKLKQMNTALTALYVKYRDVMGTLRPRHPAEGLDVVFFTKRSDYNKYGGDSETNVGIYVFEKGASFFFHTGFGDDFNTLLHEVTHQLNDKVLLTWNLPPWFEEGVAEYFGGASMTSGGKKISLDRSTGYRIQEFLEAVRGSQNRAIPLTSFLAAKSTDVSDLFYAQAWALATYLMRGPHPGKFIAFDVLVDAQRATDVYSPMDARGFERVLKRYDLTLDQFESDFIEYFREGKF